MLYILNLKGPASFLIKLIFILYQSLNWGPLDPEANDIPTHRSNKSKIGMNSLENKLYHVSKLIVMDKLNRS